ncbi:MAG: carboxypeptidase regulatory-like domain-containing protein [Acidobacteriota bacterium]
MVTLALVLLLGAAPQAPANPAPAPNQPRPITPPAASTPPAAPAPRAGAPAAPAAPARPAAPRPTTVSIKVTDRTGKALPSAQVTLEGPTGRQGTTNFDGSVTLQNVSPGTYRARIERDGSITLEKELMVRSGTPLTADASLSTAPAPPPAPTPTPTPTPTPIAPPALAAGDPRAVSIPNLYDSLQSGKDPIQESRLGCSGNTSSKLIIVRGEGIPSVTRPDIDELLYVVAGEGTLKLGDKDQSINAGWFSVVPRGTSHAITRKGRTPILLLSVMSGGEPCPPATAR